ncbi:hypothetical protein C8J56DRAFT_9901 [Mycena floridula]|nr:hypothetical protein C8J56DRAFT_9901 [Mycena floridula]
MDDAESQCTQETQGSFSKPKEGRLVWLSPAIPATLTLLFLAGTGSALSTFANLFGHAILSVAFPTEYNIIPARSSAIVGALGGSISAIPLGFGYSCLLRFVAASNPWLKLSIRLSIPGVTASTNLLSILILRSRMNGRYFMDLKYGALEGAIGGAVIVAISAVFRLLCWACGVAFTS